MKHPNAAYDLSNADTYAKAAVEAIGLSPKHAEAIRLQHKNQLTDHVLVVERIIEGKKKYLCRDRRSNQGLIEFETREVAEAFAGDCNVWTDERYLEWFNNTSNARENERQLREKK